MKKLTFSAIAFALVISTSNARADNAIADWSAMPSYCSQLYWTIEHWREIGVGYTLHARTRQVASRLTFVARFASWSGRYDVRDALTLSAYWVISGDSAADALLARKQKLDERVRLAEQKADTTVRADCHFSAFRTR